MNKDEIKVPNSEARSTFQGSPCFAQEQLAFDVGYREGFYDAIKKQDNLGQEITERKSKNRFFYFVCTYWCEGNKGTVSMPLISESFPKMSVVLEIAEKFVAERFDVPTHKVSSVIVENWIEMSEDDFQQFNSK